jgi:hypothetical protein
MVDVVESSALHSLEHERARLEAGETAQHCRSFNVLRCHQQD